MKIVYTKTFIRDYKKLHKYFWGKNW